MHCKLVGHGTGRRHALCATCRPVVVGCSRFVETVAVNMEKGRLIFTERPYAAVLDDECVRRYCATCFEKGPKYPCEKQCDFANYCSEKCSTEDWPWHQFECAAFLKYKRDQRTPKVEARCRIVARLLARFRHDEGIVSLSDGFPTFAKDRKYGDLLSHYHEIKKDTWSVKRMQALSNQFFEFFGSTPLKNTLPKTFRICFCTFRINSFCITNANENVGLGLYLNASRFNHSCCPTASARFKGGSIQIWARKDVHPDEYSTEDRFNHLTIDYGTGTHSSRAYYLTLARQRVDSLKSRYFFRCLCSGCVDSMVSLMEERAAAMECGQCGKAYIWTKKGSLEKLCTCQEPLPVTSAQDRREALLLDIKWAKLMEKTDSHISASEIMDICEPFVKRAKKMWHPSENLRLGLIMERMVVAYAQVPTPLGLSEKDCGRRADGFFSLSDFYDRFEWGHEIAGQYRGMGKTWEERRAAKEAANKKPVDFEF